MTPTDPTTPTATTQRLLTCEQVAQSLQVSAWTIKNLYRCRRLPGMIVSRKLRFRPVDVDRFIERLASEGVPSV